MNHNITTKTDKPANQMWGSEEHNYLRTQAQQKLDEYKAQQKPQKVVRVWLNPKTWIEVDAKLTKKQIEQKKAFWKAKFERDIIK